MKKAVLVVDHKERDLRGVVLIGYWLNKKYGILPYITHTQNEISCLIKYKPEVILIQHIRHKHQKEFLEFAKQQKTTIVVSLAEGYPDHIDNIMFYLGRDEYMHYVNLFLPWGKLIWDKAKKKELLSHAKILPSGAPRFDFHTKRFADLCISKHDICNLLEFDKNIPIIVWMTNFKHCPFGNMEEHIKKYENPDYSDHRRAPTIREVATSNEQAYKKISAFFLKLLHEFPNLQFIIKLHPDEPLEIYQKKFSQFKNVRILKSIQKFSLSDIIRLADIQITWRCTTSPEAWIMDLNKKVISIEPTEIESKMLKYFTIGNDVVHDYKSLKEKVTEYLSGVGITKSLKDKRLKFIHDFMFDNDGLSSERCADAIFKHSANSRPKRSLFNYMIILKYLKKYRFQKKWLHSKRSPSHAKYINPEEVHTEMKKCMKFFGNEVEYFVEM